jgi:hypothetical protein
MAVLQCYSNLFTVAVDIKFTGERPVCRKQADKRDIRGMKSVGGGAIEDGKGIIALPESSIATIGCNNMIVPRLKII